MDEELKEILARAKNPAVSCSFGIDSLVILHLCLQIKPDILVVWNNTLVEYPDTVRFARQLTKKWNLNLVETKPKVTFWDIVEKYGFPLARRGGTKEDNKNTKKYRKTEYPTDNCCFNLKKAPMKRAIRENSIDFAIDGMRRTESWTRRRLKEKLKFNKKWKTYKFHPILHWTREDVWKYVRSNHLPYNPLYDKKLDGYEVRTGCWCCTLRASYGKGLGMAHLHQYYPNLWNYLYLKKGFGRIVFQHRLNPDFFINEDNLTNWIEERPCLFFQF